MGEEDCGEGAAGRVNKSERVERRTMLGESARRTNSGVNATAGIVGAMRVVAAVVAELDVVVGREEERIGRRKVEKRRASCCGRALIGNFCLRAFAVLACAPERASRRFLDNAQT